MELWNIEEIPDDDNLFYRVHKTQMDPQEDSDFISIKVFRTREGSMSTDWDKYSNPTMSRNRARVPKENRILQLYVESVREIPMEVQHHPLPEYNNQAHTDVYGLENQDRANINEIRLKLADIAEWVNDWLIN